jgi:hypothetical protein
MEVAMIPVFMHSYTDEPPGFGELGWRLIDRWMWDLYPCNLKVEQLWL